jgi:hypothetical protein
MYYSALKNILLAALVNQFSPLVYRRDYFLTAKIVSPPRGTIMLCDIIHAESPPACSLQETGFVRKAQCVLCRKQGVCAKPHKYAYCGYPAYLQVEAVQN